MFHDVFHDPLESCQRVKSLSLLKKKIVLKAPIAQSGVIIVSMLNPTHIGRRAYRGGVNFGHEHEENRNRHAIVFEEVVA